MTGGRVLSPNPDQVRLWDKQGLTQPVALTSIWLFVAMLGAGVFLLDVAVRRVRIDFDAIGAWVRRGFGAAQTVGGQQLGGLRAAREQARERIAQRATHQGHTLTASELASQAKAAAKQAQAAASTKFEASAEALRDARRGPSVLGGADATVSKIEDRRRPVDQPQSSGEKKPDEGMSRLLKAKKKAQEEMEDG
jgi:hypothetical protein